jgi:hypothetical protein
LPFLSFHLVNPLALFARIAAVDVLGELKE